MTPEERQLLRFKYLKQLYELVDAQVAQPRDKWEIGKKLGLDRRGTADVFEYLLRERLVSSMGMDYVTITHEGVKEIEQALTKPDYSTEHFPPVINIVNVEKMVNSQVQQGTIGSEQKYAMQRLDGVQFREAISQLRTKLQQIELTDVTRQEIEIQFATIEKQLESQSPNSTIIGLCVETVNKYLVGTELWDAFLT